MSKLNKPPDLGDELTNLGAKIAATINVASSVRIAGPLPRVLEHILLVGNRLNEGKLAGNATALSLAGLYEKLASVKSESADAGAGAGAGAGASYTLLSYLAEWWYAEDNASGVAKLHAELEFLDAFLEQGPDDDSIRKTLDALKQRFGQLETVKQKMEADHLDGDELYTLVEEDIDGHSKQMADLLESMDKMDASINHMITYLSQDAAPLKEILRPIADLYRAVKNAHAENKERAEKEKLLAAKKLEGREHMLLKELGPFSTNKVDHRQIDFQYRSQEMPAESKATWSYEIMQIKTLPDEIRTLLPEDAATSLKPTGNMSPTSPVTLPRDKRIAAGIPLEAETFAWAYPLDGVAKGYEGWWPHSPAPFPSLS